jgi:hypothetical protein
LYEDNKESIGGKAYVGVSIEFIEVVRGRKDDAKREEGAMRKRAKKVRMGRKAKRRRTATATETARTTQWSVTLYTKANPFHLSS